MRWILLLTTVISAALFISAHEALAHGGTYRGPGSWGPPPPPSMRCDCADLACKHCSAAGLAGLAGVSQRRATHRTLERWGDLVLVETRICFKTRKSGFVEGHAAVRHAPLFAAFAGAVEIGQEKLQAVLKASAAARRDYLFERRRSRDPLLVLRIDTGAVRLRVFPILKKYTTYAVVRGYALSDEIGGEGVRAYRTGTRYLVVASPHALPKGTKPDLLDRGGNRALFFLDEATARTRFGAAVVKRAREVPCVAALRAAVRNEGVDAVTKHGGLVAVPPGGGAPKDLVIGTRPSRGVPPPPPMREPSDPPPPPTTPTTLAPPPPVPPRS